MELPVDLFEPRLIHVRVDLCGGDAGVPEHLLDLTQVRSTGQYVRGESCDATCAG